MERTAGAGVQVTVERTGAVRALPAGIDLSAFRIVQEALTNVVKHSGADRCQVRLDYGACATCSSRSPIRPAPGRGGHEPRQVRRGARRPGQGRPGRPPRRTAPRASLAYPALQRAGHGIIGMRERVSLCGGEFSAAPLPDGGFGVRARLPLHAAPMTLRVLVADDQALVRAGFRGIVAATPGFSVVGEAGTGAEAVRAGPPAPARTWC